MTLDELDNFLPNGFHDTQITSMELDYVAGTATLNVELLVGWPEDPEPERQAYQAAVLKIAGMGFCSIEPPFASYDFIPDGNPITASGDPAKTDHLPSLVELSGKFPEGVWCYRFFVIEWNGFIHIAGRDAEVNWIGPKPKHAK